jgi:DNA repair protein RadC
MIDRDHLAALFVNGTHQITGAHVIAVGAQHGIGAVDVRVVFRAALAACANAIVLGHNHPSEIRPRAQKISRPRLTSCVERTSSR